MYRISMRLAALLVSGFFCQSVHAQTCAVVPFVNGTTADATQLNNYLACLAPLANPLFTGDVGIGTLAPTTALTVKKSTAYAAPDQVAYFDDISTDAYTDIHEIARFGRSNFGGTSASASILATGYDLSGYFSSNLMTSSGLLTRDYATRSGGYLAISNSASTGARSSFQFGGVDQGGASYVSMNIDSGGNVGIDTVSPTLTLYVNGTSGGTSAWTNTSDARLKKNIVPISGALDLIEALQGVRFDWRQPDERSVGKALNLPAGERQIGFIAQDVEKVLPEAISQAKGREALLGVEESKVVPVLVEAVKQLAAANRSQSAQIEKLEQRISLLERKNATSTADVQSPR